MKKRLFEIRNLTKNFPSGKEQVRALTDVSFDIYEGETLGLVGESGCGKSTLGKCLIGLTPPTSGSIRYEGKEVSLLRGKDLRAFRSQTSLIFQDPYSSLNPRMTAADIIGEPLAIQGASKQQREKRIEELLHLVGLSPSMGNRFPHEFSGGQRQRIGIARALAAGPRFVICDEPVSALDVSVQAQIINLLKKLQQEMGLTYLFIAHDLRIVKYLSNRVAVLYRGEIVECAEAEELYHSPLHPYTQALLSAIPIPDPQIEKKRRRIVLSGEIPSPFEILKGCPFASRCPKATAHCHEVKPLMREISPGHHAACHYASQPLIEQNVPVSVEKEEITGY